MQKNSHKVSQKSSISAAFLKLTTALVLSLMVFLGDTTLASQAAPNLELKKLDNSSFKLSDYKGDVLYVDFWATWCPPCRKSFPWMEEMQQRYSDLGFKVVAVSLDVKRGVIDQFLGDMKTSFIIAHDKTGDSASQFKVQGMPTSFLIDRKGNIHLMHQGFKSSDKSKLEAEIKKLITAD